MLGDPALVEAVAAATRLSATNAALDAEVRAQLGELAASRRRLLVAADEERRRLESRLREGPERRLAALQASLDRVPSRPHAPAGEAVGRARHQLNQTLQELDELARGLHPRELAEAGLAQALASLTASGPVPVELSIRAQDLPAELAATVYFFCAEALANVAKHASASRVRIDVAHRDGRLAVVVVDDGAAARTRSRGTGLQGLADRVEALGGRLEVVSEPTTGTRLAAEIPLRPR